MSPPEAGEGKRRGGVPLKAAATIACLISLAGFATGAIGSGAHVAGRSAKGRCPVTVPTRTVSPDAGFGPGAFNHGNARLRVQLNWPSGVLRAGILADGGSFAIVDRNGSVRAKVGWWVRDVARLSVVGRRLDRPGLPLRAEIPSGYGPHYDAGASLGFQPTGLFFPTVGCWRVVGKAGTARLMFVVKVTKLN